LESIFFPASGWVVCDKRLDVVSSRGTSVEKGGHDDEAAMFNRAPWLSITDVYVGAPHRGQRGEAAGVSAQGELLVRQNWLVSL